MKKFFITVVASVSILVMTGCGEDKTPDQIAFQQKKEIMAMEYAHQREMARIEAKKIQAANPVSHTYVENEYDQRSYQQDNYQQDHYEQAQPQVRNSGYEAGQSAQTGYIQSVDQGSQPQSQPQGDEGFGVGSMALAALGGAAAGYFAGEMLNNGMKSYKDDRGNTHYTDKDGRPVSKAQYEDYKKANPKTTAFREKASDLKAKTVAGASAVKDKAVATKDKVVNSDRMQQMRTQAIADKEKVQQNQKYQQSKTYTQDTSKAIQGKMESRIPPKPTATQSRPVVKPQAKPASRPVSRPSGKRR